MDHLTQNLANLFGEESEPKGPGRQSLISDDKLLDRRNQLLQIFAGTWGEIARELAHCKDPVDIKTIFDILPNTYAQDVLWIFRQSGIEPKPAPDSKELHMIRVKIRDVSDKRSEVQTSEIEKRQNFNYASAALSMCAAKRERRQVSRAYKKVRRTYAKAAYAYHRLQKTEKKFWYDLLQMEASFARAEVFDFAQHKPRRYELNPLYLANAAAGLPYMVWRRSMQRCNRSKPEESLWYQIFKAIRYLSRGAYLKTEQNFITEFIAGIGSIPHKYERAKVKLAEDRWFIESAARQSWKMKLHPNDLAFEIMKRYAKQLRTSTPIQTLLAQQSRLVLPSRTSRQ